MDVLVARGDPPVGGLDGVFDGAHELFAGDALLGVELEEGADEVAIHDAPSFVCSALLRPTGPRS